MLVDAPGCGKVCVTVLSRRLNLVLGGDRRPLRLSLVRLGTLEVWVGFL